MPSWSASRAASRLVAPPLLAGLLLLLVQAWVARLAVVPITLQSSSATAILEIDGATHSIHWTARPMRLILPRSPAPPDWTPAGAPISANDGSPSSGPLDDLALVLRGDRETGTRLDVRLTRRDDQPLRVEGALPASFVLRLALVRPSRVVAFALAERDGGRDKLIVDRDGRRIRLEHDPHAGPPEDRAAWFFPRDSRPWAVTMVWRLLGVGAIGLISVAGLALLAVALGSLTRRMRRSQITVLAIPAVSATVVGLPALTALVTGILAVRVLGPLPTTIDGQAYLAQAGAMALGHLTLALPADPTLFPLPFTGPIRERLVAQYAPGTAALLASGVLFGYPWLVEPLLSVATAALVAWIGKREDSAAAGVLAGLVVALSPLQLTLAGSFLSHVPAMFFLTLAYAALVAGRWGDRTGPCALAGLALGAAALCREGSALVVGGPLVLAVAVRALQCPRRRWPALGLLLLSASIGIGLLAAYDTAVTGSPWQSPRAVLDPSDRPGFGPGIGFLGGHTPAAGLATLDRLMAGFGSAAVGWPYPLILSLGLLPFLLGRPRAADLTRLAMIVGAALLAWAYYSPAVGDPPRYLAEALPAVALLATRGLQLAARRIDTAADSVVRAPGAGRAASALLATALVACDVGWALPSMLRPSALAPLAATCQTAVANGTPPGALILVPDRQLYQATLSASGFPMLAGRLGDGRVWAYAPPGALPVAGESAPRVYRLRLRPPMCTVRRA